MKKMLLILLLALQVPARGELPPIQTVFLIVCENQNWSFLKGNPNMPYLNLTLLPRSSYCEQYFNPPTIHPSLPNYIWLEAGTNFGILNGSPPGINHQSSTNHLTTLLKNAGISWKSYYEDIDGTFIALTNINAYAVRHNAFAYFDDVTGTNDPNDSYGLAHIRPYSELAGDLANETVARYNVIIPNLCDDGHDSCSPQFNPVQQIDQWLATAIPPILHSAAYSNNGAIFITFDEGANNSDSGLGMIVLSPSSRGGGYACYNYCTHSSTLRTFQEIFGVRPFLGEAATVEDLGELFAPFAITQTTRLTNGNYQLWISGVISGRTNLVQASTNFTVWNSISTNVVATNNFSVIDDAAPGYVKRYYRAVQLP